jgi:hypothetical protein
MSAKERLKTLIETIYVIYTNVLLESHKPPEKPLTREEIQERERQEALRTLEEEKSRMSSGV